jgi:NADPH:quinone reductase-like Zn-dependent oxidoreductase
MTTTRAILVDPGAPAHLALGEAELSPALRNEATVRVAAISLNRGEVRRAQDAAAGDRLGWDIAGVVEHAAMDGSGPKAGARVVGILRTGAWSELLNLPTTNLAVLPDGVGFEDAATLPVAALTALYALDRANGLAGRNVLVTGASGGVGHFAVQLAAMSGATVTGLVRQERHAAVVSEAGAAHVVADGSGAAAGQFGPYDHILDSVGGETFANIATMLAPGGQIVSYGVSAGGKVEMDVTPLFRSRGSFSSFLVFDEMMKETAAVGLRRLLGLLADGRLKPLISLREDWSEIGPVAQQLLDRSFPGKAVLTVS